MNAYLALKTLHIISSAVIVGTGGGTAFYMYFANRSRSPEAIVVVSKLVVRADWWFTTPAALFQPSSGLLMAHMAGWPWSTPWLGASMLLYVIAGVCWIPVLWLQHRMASIASQAHQCGSTLPQEYWRRAKQWELLGYPAFIAMIMIYFLMVLKPANF